MLDTKISNVKNKFYKTHLAIHDCKLDIKNLTVLEKALP